MVTRVWRGWADASRGLTCSDGLEEAPLGALLCTVHEREQLNARNLTGCSNRVCPGNPSGIFELKRG